MDESEPRVVPEAILGTVSVIVTDRQPENVVPEVACVSEADETFDKDLVDLMKKEIELSKSAKVAEDLKRKAEQIIKSRYRDMQRKRRDNVETLARARLTEHDKRAISAAAQREGLRSAAEDVRVVRDLAANEQNIRQMEREQYIIEAKEREELERRAASLTILSNRLDTSMRVQVSKLKNIPTVSECCRCASFDDTNFAKMCCLVACPYPGLCYVQNLVLQKLSISPERVGKPAFNVLFEQTGFAGLGLLTCCFGLAWNRERVHEETETGQTRFFFDCLMFMCCLGQILVLQDVLFSQKASPKVDKPFTESFWAIFNIRKLQSAWNCIGCCAAVCCPIPALCLLQGYDVMATQEVLRSVTANPLVSSSEKRTIILTYGALSCLTCCFGMALNRTWVANALGLDEYLMCDCLKSAVGCCFCSIIQEFYTTNAMRAPLKVKIDDQILPPSPAGEPDLAV